MTTKDLIRRLNLANIQVIWADNKRIITQASTYLSDEDGFWWVN